MQSRAVQAARRAAPAAPLARALSTAGSEVAATSGAPVDSYYAGKERVVAGPMQRLRQSACARGAPQRRVWGEQGARAARATPQRRASSLNARPVHRHPPTRPQRRTACRTCT
jgi:hypothetical protein